MSCHLRTVHQDHRHLNSFRQTQSASSNPPSSKVTITGSSLSLSELVTISRFRTPTALNPESPIRERVEKSARYIIQQTAPGTSGSVYGVTTGFGASGINLRTNDRTALQRAILHHLTSGILPTIQAGPPDAAVNASVVFDQSLDPSLLLLPESWVKGALVLRINSLMRGHSGVRWTLIEKLHALLENDIIPSPPLRQSISASGDLAPLGYIAASLTEDVVVPVWSGKGPDRRRIPSIQALREHGLSTYTYGPKEVLAVVNGTGPSCAVGALALHDANLLALAAQVTTAMAVEAMLGTPESFEPFIHDVARPHVGQVECARNIRALLKDSKLARLFDEFDPAQTLRQDRYGLRTAPQWIGPHLEELVAARKVIEIEMNSTTDNPIVDVEQGRIVSGGNFQGTSIAVVMEKTRIALQHFGKLAFAQFTELISPHMNRGLPSDLAAYEPSLDFGAKAMDVAMAAYMSELSYVSNTVTNHVQSAEHQNQAVNSLALISARYTFTAIQVLYMMYSNHLWGLCQAIDLRAMIAKFQSRMEIEIRHSLEPIFKDDGDDEHRRETELSILSKNLFNQARVSFNQTVHLDSTARFTEVLRPLIADLDVFLSTRRGKGQGHVSECRQSSMVERTFDIAHWHINLATKLGLVYRETRKEYYESGGSGTEDLLGKTRAVYVFVRRTLGVPMRQGGDLDKESYDSQLSRIYRSFETGSIASAFLEAMDGELSSSNEVKQSKARL